MIKKGKWKFVPEILVIENIENGYQVDLERMTDSAQALDWIFQVAAKSGDWDVKGLIEVIEEVSWIYFGTTSQGLFCPGGKFIKDICWKIDKSEIQ